MLKIRLSRAGKKGQPSFRIVVQEHTAPIKGKFVEELGFYRPASAEKELKVDLERVKHWIKVGAKPSDSVAVLLKKEGMDGMDEYIAPRDKQKKKKKAEEVKEEKPPQAAPAEESAPAEEKPAEDAPVEQAPAEEKPTEEAPAEEPPAEEKPTEEAPAEEPPAEEKPTEEPPAEEPQAS